MNSATTFFGWCGIGVSRTVRLVRSRLTDHTSDMENVRTLLSPIREGRIWRVKIVWPNRAVHYFGTFTSEQDAVGWITAHPRLARAEDTMDEP
jgi:hypothetical protein